MVPGFIFSFFETLFFMIYNQDVGIQNKFIFH